MTHYVNTEHITTAACCCLHEWSGSQDSRTHLSTAARARGHLLQCRGKQSSWVLTLTLTTTLTTLTTHR